MTARNKRKLAYGTVEVPAGAFLPRNVKERITIMLDQDVLDFYRTRAAKRGERYQTLINRALRETMAKPGFEARLTRIERKLKIT